MLDLVAGELWYLGLIRLMDVESLAPCWTVSATLTRGRVLAAVATTPDAALYHLALRTLTRPIVRLPASTAVLDLVADELLRLLLRRPRLWSPGSEPRSWTATIWLRDRRTVTGVGDLPEEALRHVVTLVPRGPLH